MTYRYRAFGLTLESEVRLDELQPENDASEPANITIRRGEVGHPILPMGNYSHFDFSDPDDVLMVWPGAAGVRIKGPDLVVIEPFRDVPERYLAFPLLGPVMGWMLHLREMLVLHASAVVHRGVPVAFIGDKTAGKSTTATAFLAARASLLTDDLLAFRFDDRMQCLAMPAFGQFKLDASGPGAPNVPNARELPLVMEGFEKLQYRVPQLHEEPIRPGPIFVLERGGTEPEVEWLGLEDALAAIIRFGYNMRFVHAPVEQQHRARHFRQAVALHQQARIGRLTIPHDLSRLPEVVALIEKVTEVEGV